MAYPVPHNVLQIIGTHMVGATPEIWSNTLRIGKPSGGGTSATPASSAILADIAADLTTWWNSMATEYHTSTKMTGFKFNGVGLDGKYLSSTETVRYEFPNGGLAGTATTSSLPAQCAVVVSLGTEAARGLAHRGRVYLPAPSISAVAAGGVLGGTRAPAFRDRYRTLITNLNDWPGLDAAADPGVVSIVSDVREGAIRKVTTVAVGERFDIQRRRANAFKENLTLTSPVP